MTDITAFPDAEGFTRAFSLDDSDALRAFYQEQGFVVVKDIIDSPAQIEETIEEIWSLLRIHNATIDKNDSATWDNKTWPTYLGLKDGK